MEHAPKNEKPGITSHAQIAQAISDQLRVLDQAISLETEQITLLKAQANRLWSDYKAYHEALPLQMRNGALFHAEEIAQHIEHSAQQLRALNNHRRIHLANMLSAMNQTRPPYRDSAASQIYALDGRLKKLVAQCEELEKTSSQPISDMLSV